MNALVPPGKVAIRKEDLSKYSGKEHWFGLQPVDANSEVQVCGIAARVFHKVLDSLTPV